MNGKPSRRQSWEAWWSFAFRVGSGVGGLAILVGQAFGVADPRLPLTVAGIGLCGPVVAAAAGSFFETLRSAK